MADDHELQALLRLTAWLSPAFPVGSFAYSGGLERAVADGLVRDAGMLRRWLEMLTGHGPVWNDAILLAESHRGHGDGLRLAALSELAAALAGSRERHQETILLGDAFLTAAQAWPDDVFGRLPKGAAYPVAIGAVTGAHGIALEKALAAFLHAYLSQAVSAGIRLGVAGQKDGVAILAGMEEHVMDIATSAARASLDNLGSATVQADIAGLRHETQQTRLFRS